MPIGALVGAGLGAFGAGINAAQTARQNKKSREWSERMYDRQYNDNIRFWNMQNDYNSPQRQMQRLEAAGINPHAFYAGSGNPGTASNIATPDVQKPQFDSPQFGNTLSSLGSIYDFELKQAQVDNLKAKNTTEFAQAALLAAQVDMSEFDLGLKSELRQVTSDAARAALKNTRADTFTKLREDERRQALTGRTLIESAEKVLNMREDRARSEWERKKIKKQLENIRQDTRLKKLSADLNKSGVYASDGLFARILGRILGNYGGPLELKKKLEEGINHMYYNP
jgi:hypothetical protein